MTMTEAQNKSERRTWLRYEFIQLLEQCQRGACDPRQLAASAAALTNYHEVDELADELLQHTFWASQHLLHRPACWAPTSAELDYLLRCLREEEIFDPSQVEFTYSPKNV